MQDPLCLSWVGLCRRPGPTFSPYTPDSFGLTLPWCRTPSPRDSHRCHLLSTWGGEAQPSKKPPWQPCLKQTPPSHPCQAQPPLLAALLRTYQNFQCSTSPGSFLYIPLPHWTLALKVQGSHPSVQHGEPLYEYTKVSDCVYTNSRLL